MYVGTYVQILIMYVQIGTLRNSQAPRRPVALYFCLWFFSISLSGPFCTTQATIRSALYLYSLNITHWDHRVGVGTLD